MSLFKSITDEISYLVLTTSRYFILGIRFNVVLVCGKYIIRTVKIILKLSRVGLNSHPILSVSISRRVFNIVSNIL